jgi:hypothetical protein
MQGKKCGSLYVQSEYLKEKKTIRLMVQGKSHKRRDTSVDSTKMNTLCQVEKGGT